MLVVVVVSAVPNSDPDFDFAVFPLDAAVLYIILVILARMHPPHPHGFEVGVTARAMLCTGTGLC